MVLKYEIMLKEIEDETASIEKQIDDLKALCNKLVNQK